MAAPECEREARKRRERRDSGCAHERKERRPHSEERAPAPPMPPLHDYNRIESERRAERLSRARRPQFGGKRRRQPPRDRAAAAAAAAALADAPKENECLLRAELAPGNASPPPPPRLDASPSNRHHQEPATAGLDLAALHLQLGRSEPARSHAAERARPADPAAPADPATPPRPRDPAAHTDKRLDKINKKIGILKRNIARHESECESRSGHALSASERATDVQLTRMSEALRRLQAEKRLIKSDPLEYTLKVQAAKQQKLRDEVLELALHSDKSMADVVLDIEQWLEGTRVAEGRGGPESSWSGAQLAAEKACVQRVLLRLEAARGRPPAHSADRGAARHIYDRYRTMKRLVAGLRADAVYINGELATIHEHETMCFSSTDSDSKQKHSDTDQESSEPVSSPTTRSAEEAASTASSARSAADDPPSPPSTDALHCLTPAQLAAALSDAHALKLVLRRSIKEYEFSVRADQSSRKLQPEDKIGKEDEYRKYKAVKARIKLLNALINKQKLSQQ